VQRPASSETWRPEGWLRAWRVLAPHLPVLFLLAACLGLGVSRTADLSWPHDADLYRNMAQAQVMADGDFFADPFYAGEKAWYNPLTPAVVALLHRVTGLEMPVLYARAGAYLNLAVPLAFYVLAQAFLGRLGGLLATFYLVFLGHPGEASWMRPAYAPWFFAGSFGQVFFYLGLAAYAKAARVGGSRRAFACVGLLLGLAFLSHTAPALLLGGVVAAEASARAVRALGWFRRDREPEDGLPWAGHALLYAVAVVVSIPFLATILGFYHLRVVNAAGNDWFWWPFELARFGAYAAGHVSLAAVLALAGVLLLVRDRARLESRLISWWLGLSLAFVLYALASQWAAPRGLHLLNVVAPHHFWLYVKAAGALGWGHALANLLRRAGARVPWAGVERNANAWVLAATVAGTALALPTLAAREDFARARREALAESARTWRDEIRQMLRTRAAPHEVVLADPDDALMFVGPSGRKTVSVLANFANPYVAARPREEDTRRMFSALAAEDAEAFLPLAGRYRVAWVLHRRTGRFGLDRHALPFLVRELRAGPFILYRVDAACLGGGCGEDEGGRAHPPEP